MLPQLYRSLAVFTYTYLFDNSRFFTFLHNYLWVKYGKLIAYSAYYMLRVKDLLPRGNRVRIWLNKKIVRHAQIQYAIRDGVGYGIFNLYRIYHPREENGW